MDSVFEVVRRVLLWCGYVLLCGLEGLVMLLGLGITFAVARAGWLFGTDLYLLLVRRWGI